MVIDRQTGADRRAQRRAAFAQDTGARGPGLGAASMELADVLNPAGKHDMEHLRRVAVAREDPRESGELDSGVVRLQRRPTR